MSEHTFELTEKNFDEKIKEGVWAVDFWAEWCGPCKIMAPDFEAAAKELTGKVNFGKIDIEANYELASRYNVMSIPTMIIFKNGEVEHVVVGAMKKGQILSQIENIK